MRKNCFSSLHSGVEQLLGREHTLLGRQRLAMLLFCLLPVTLLGIAANLSGVSGPDAAFFDYTHVAFLIAAATACLLLFKGRIQVGSCLCILTQSGQIMVTAEMIFCAFHPSEYHLMLIVADIVLLAMNMMVSMAANLKWNTLVLGVLTLATYLACMVITGNRALASFLGVFAVSFVFVSVAGWLVSQSTLKLERENNQLRHDEAEILHILRMRKAEVNAFIALTTKKSPPAGCAHLFERLPPKSRHNLLANVDGYLKATEASLATLERVFPELTPSEREICNLIVQGKKLSEICAILNKTETNVNSQRANVRRKLGLQPADHLQSKLAERLAAAQPTQNSESAKRKEKKRNKYLPL